MGLKLTIGNTSTPNQNLFVSTQTNLIIYIAIIFHEKIVRCLSRQIVLDSPRITLVPQPTFRALARGEGTNSARLFIPGEREALAKSKVHQ